MVGLNETAGLPEMFYLSRTDPHHCNGRPPKHFSLINLLSLCPPISVKLFLDNVV